MNIKEVIERHFDEIPNEMRDYFDKVRSHKSELCDIEYNDSIVRKDDIDTVSRFTIRGDWKLHHLKDLYARLLDSYDMRGFDIPSVSEFSFTSARTPERCVEDFLESKKYKSNLEEGIEEYEGELYYHFFWSPRYNKERRIFKHASSPKTISQLREYLLSGNIITLGDYSYRLTNLPSLNSAFLPQSIRTSYLYTNRAVKIIEGEFREYEILGDKIFYNCQEIFPTTEEEVYNVLFSCDTIIRYNGFKNTLEKYLGILNSRKTWMEWLYSFVW
jgi:hypothetical protein